MSKKADDRKKIVILGGGGFGGTLARELSAKLDPSKHNLILINPRPFYIHILAAVRFTVTAEDKLEDRALIPYDNIFHKGNGTFIQGKVAHIHDNGSGKGGQLALANGERVDYDVLVLATGANWNGPFSFPDDESSLRSSIDAWRSKFAGANDIVFVGGGAVSIETAAEVRGAFPDKKVTIVHSDELLLSDVYPTRFRKHLTSKVLKRGIELILNDRVEDIPVEGTIGVKTQSGKELSKADLVIPSYGSTPNTAVVSTLGPDVLNERGFVKVTTTLELPNHPGIFAIGDIIDYPEQKQLGKSDRHSATASANILSYLAGKPQTKLYTPMPEMIVIPLGKSGGASYFGVLWGIIIGDWLTWLIKGRDLITWMYRKKFGMSA